MSLHGSWHDNVERGQWEATLGPFHAVARLNEQSGRYMAFLEDATTRGTNHYAPDSFSDPDEARAWCEAEAERLLAEQATLRPDPDVALKRRIDDTLDG
jgi:hypothetical protein